MLPCCTICSMFTLKIYPSTGRFSSVALSASLGNVWAVSVMLPCCSSSTYIWRITTKGTGLGSKNSNRIHQSDLQRHNCPVRDSLAVYAVDDAGMISLNRPGQLEFYVVSVISGLAPDLILSCRLSWLSVAR